MEKYHINKLDSDTKSEFKPILCVDNSQRCLDKSQGGLSNENILDDARNGDTTSQIDIVRRQYSYLPFPAVKKGDLYDEKYYYDSDLGDMPYLINLPIALEQINHFLYNGGNDFT